jgi:hypothetical protein
VESDRQVGDGGRPGGSLAGGLTTSIDGKRWIR